MRQRQTLPQLWLLSDQRNQHVIEPALRSLRVPAGFIFRDYHLSPHERAKRFARLQRICHHKGHVAIVSTDRATARRMGADGVYGAPLALGLRRNRMVTIATAHSLREIARANRMGADAIMLSAVFPTRSHPGGRTLGPLRFRLMACRAATPVIALVGMNPRNARRLKWNRWAAIDGLS